MTKTASRARTSRAIKQVPQTAQDNAEQLGAVFAHQQVKPGVDSSEPVKRQHLLAMTEDEGLQVVEARCMLQLLEDLTLCTERDISISSGPLAVMMSVIGQKLAFKPRLMPVDADGFLQERQ